MKICLISHYAGLGGAERALLETVEALRTYGVDSFVLLPGQGALCRELNRRDIPFRILPYRWWAGTKGTPFWRRGKDLALSLLCVPAMAAEIRRRRCDLVLTNTITIGAGAMAARVAGCPHVWFIHEFFGTRETDLFFYLGPKLSFAIMDRLSELCLANSKTVARAYRTRLPNVPVRPVYQSVTPAAGPEGQAAKTGSPAASKEDPGVPRPFRCVAVGTLCALKGQMDAVRAVSELAKSGHPVTLDLVGGGDPVYSAGLQRAVHESGIGHLVRFRGRVADAFPFTREADAALICSRSESFGRATVEAMLAGKPVIGARRGATGELIRKEFNGLLYRPGDAAELAGKIRRLMNHPDQALRMGRNGREWAQTRFSRERFGRRLMSLLAPLLK